MRIAMRWIAPALTIGTLTAASLAQMARVHGAPGVGAERPVTAAENAALRYWRTWTFLSEADRDWIEGVDFASIGEAGFTLDEPTRTRLAEEAGTIDGLIEAAGMARSDFGVDYDKGPGALLTHLSAMRVSARLLALDARVAFDEGETERGVRSLAAAFATSQHCAGEGLVISSLVSAVCFDVADRVAAYASSAGMLGDADRDALCEALGRFDAQDPFGVRAAIRGEFEVLGGWYERLAEGDVGELKASIESLAGEATARTLVAPLERVGEAEADRMVREQVSQFESYYRLAARAWNAPDAEARLADLSKVADAGGFGPMTQTFGVSLANVHRRDVQAREMFEARATDLGCD